MCTENSDNMSWDVGALRWWSECGLRDLCVISELYVSYIWMISECTHGVARVALINEHIEVIWSNHYDTVAEWKFKK